MLKDAQDNNIHCVTEIPYFEGDYWPNIIEESIKEQDKEEDKRRKEEVEAAIAGEGPESVPESEDVNSEVSTPIRAPGCFFLPAFQLVICHLLEVSTTMDLHTNMSSAFLFTGS